MYIDIEMLSVKNSKEWFGGNKWPRSAAIKAENPRNLDKK